jgi:hypothetical protein
MPEVIVIDEIGTELEAEAARTIAERGVQLVGTAHGNTLENLLLNPTLSDLVGGIQPVTLGDEEARRRGTQKTVLERKAPPTFDVLVEMQERQRVAVHRDVAETVDAALRSQPVAVEVRSRRDDGSVERRLEVLGRYGAGDGRGGRTPRGGFDEELGGRGDRYERRDRDDRSDRSDRAERGGRRNGRGGWADRWERTLAAREEYHRRPEFGAYGPRGGQSATWARTEEPGAWSPRAGVAVAEADEGEERDDEESAVPAEIGEGTDRFRRTPAQAMRPMKLYPFGVNRDRLENAIAALRLPVTITKDVRDADVVMTLKNYYRRSPGPVRDAEGSGKPVFILKSNTTPQIQQSLEALYGMETADPPRDLQDLVLRETQDAIQRVLKTSQPVDLPPQNAYVRRLQHQLAEQFNVGSRSTGREPHRRVRLFKP